MRLASDEGAVLHLVRCQHEPDAPDGIVLEDRADVRIEDLEVTRGIST